MARFDIYFNPNKSARHPLFVNVQSNLVRLSTRWCIPLSRHIPTKPIIQGVQAVMDVAHQKYVLDTPNLLPVPAALLRHPLGRMSPNDQLAAESCIDFMLRGY